MTQREDKQRARTSREELGKFFYNLAAMCFGTTVFGSGMALVTDTGNPERLLGMFAGGIIGTIALAYAAFRIIKIIIMKQLDFTTGMTLVFGIIALIAVAINIWLSTKWGKKWLHSLD